MLYLVKYSMSNPNAPIIHGLVFAGNSEATNLGVEQLPNDPAYRKGRIWFNTTEEKLKFYPEDTTTAWVISSGMNVTSIQTVTANGVALSGPNISLNSDSTIQVTGNIQTQTISLHAYGVPNTRMLTSNTTSNVVTLAIVPNSIIQLEPNKSVKVDATFGFRSAAATTGLVIGVRLIAPATGDAMGSIFGTVQITSTASATGLSDGDVLQVSNGGNSFFSITGTGATTAANNAAQFNGVFVNSGTSNATVQFEFASEVAASTITLLAGSAITYTIH